MLSHRALELKVKIEQKQRLLIERKNIQAFKTRSAQIANLTTKIEGIYLTTESFKAKGIKTSNYNPQFLDVLTKLTEIKQTYSKDPDWVKEQNVLDPLTRKIDKLSTEINVFFKEQWSQYVRNIVPHLNSEVLMILAKIPSFTEKTQKIYELYKDIDKDIELVPQKVSDFEKVERKCTYLTELWNQLGAEDVPDSVILFLRKTTTQNGAPLSLLTSEVTQWLQQHKIDQFISVRISNQ